MNNTEIQKKALAILADPAATEEQWMLANQALSDVQIKVPFWFARKRSLFLRVIDQTPGFNIALGICVAMIFLLCSGGVTLCHTADVLAFSLAVLYGAICGISRKRKDDFWVGIKNGTLFCATFFSAHWLFPGCAGEIWHLITIPTALFAFHLFRDIPMLDKALELHDQNTRKNC